MLDMYAMVLPEALRLIAHDHTTEAEMMVNNLYHLKKRSSDDFMTLLRLTAHHRAFIEANDDVRNKLLKILFMLDKKHNSPRNSIYIKFVKKTWRAEGENLNF